MSCKLVALFKSRDQTGNDLYETAFHEAGYSTLIVPVLAFKFTSGLDSVLKESNNYSGLVLTSQRAVQALDIVLSRLECTTDTWSTWKSKPFFVVGQHTAAELQRLGFTPAIPPANTASALAEQIVEYYTKHRPPWSPLLFLCSSLKREELPEVLANHNIPLQEFVAYTTLNNIDDSIISELRGIAAPCWACFFSPSGVTSVSESELFHQWWVESAHRPRAAAIGKTTANALATSPIGPADAIAAQPTPEGLLQAMLAAEQ